MAEHWHRHSGVYGIGVRDGKMPVIRKRRGPYAGRYDLPGGSAEPDETLAETLRREFREETGLGVHILRCLGAQDWATPGGRRRAARRTSIISRFSVKWRARKKRRRAASRNQAAQSGWNRTTTIRPARNGWNRAA